MSYFKAEITNESPLLAQEKMIPQAKKPRSKNYHRILLLKRFSVFLVALSIFIAGIFLRQIKFKNENTFTLFDNSSANSSSVH